LKKKVELRKHNSKDKDQSNSIETDIGDVISNSSNPLIIRDGFNIPVSQKKIISISGSYLILTAGGYFKDAWIVLKN